MLLISIEMTPKRATLSNYDAKSRVLTEYVRFITRPGDPRGSQDSDRPGGTSIFDDRPFMRQRLDLLQLSVSHLELLSPPFDFVACEARQPEGECDTVSRRYQPQVA